MTSAVPSPDQAEAARVFGEQRDLLMAVAYRVLGRVADAEDVVQEAWLRWADARPSEVVEPRAFLVRVTTRLAIDRIRRIQARRESYVGPWLPEPILTGPDIADEVEQAESVSMALLLVLETLSPLERAVFVLREAFAFSYGEIADAIGRSEAAVRQLARRARDHVRERRSRFEADQATRQRVTERFLTASKNGDFNGLMELLAPGVTLVADGGGRARAPRRPILGVDRVARFLVAATARPFPDQRILLAQVNGGPGLVVTSEGTTVATLVLDVADDRVQTIYLVANPDKLVGVRAIESS
jgi:RNA polymerase sigma-70 factor, ECF subfamily